jgi:hypothetical protein
MDRELTCLLMHSEQAVLATSSSKPEDDLFHLYVVESR